MRGKQWDISSGLKPCPKCGGIKPLSEFGANKYAASGLAVYCKVCVAAAARARRATPEGRKSHYESTLKWISGLPDAERAEGFKTCPKCNVKKPFAEYPKNRRNKYGINTYCLVCSAEMVREIRATPRGQATHRAASKRWREAHKERHADNNAKWKYGVEHGTYATLFAKQSGRCAICDSSPADDARLHIDHCHDTGRIRGLLCNRCNNGIGRFKHDVTLLSRAIAYLSSPEGS